MNGYCDFCPRLGRLATCHCGRGHENVGVWVCAEKHEPWLNSIEIACRVCSDEHPFLVAALYETVSPDPDRAPAPVPVADAAEQGGELRPCACGGRVLMPGVDEAEHDGATHRVGYLCFEQRPLRYLYPSPSFVPAETSCERCGRPAAPGPDRALELLRELVAAYGTSPWRCGWWRMRSMNTDEVSPELEAATVALHAALDAHPVRLGHNYDGEWVDDNSYAVVEALLAAGWTHPAGPSKPEGATGGGGR